jgi:hypothetical protein
MPDSSVEDLNFIVHAAKLPNLEEIKLIERSLSRRQMENSFTDLEQESIYQP